MKRYFAKIDSPPEKALQEVEGVLQKHGMIIERSYDGLNVIYKGKRYNLTDSEGNDSCGCLPRSFESERMKVADHD